MKAVRIGYYVVLGLFTAMMLASVFFYLFQNETVRENFTSLNFPPFLIYPLALAKLLGLVAIWTKRSVILKEWAYAGFVFNALLAAGAHLNAGDGEAAGAFMALALILTAYFLEKRLFPNKALTEAPGLTQTA